MKRKINDKLPLVSVIMPVYNASAFLSQAIESILTQTYKKFELVIIDNNSNDNSLEIIKSYKNRHPKKIRVIKLNKNYGAFGGANIGLKLAKGQFIAPMDADDISEPNRLKKQISYLLKNKDVIVLGSQAKIIDRNGNVIGKKVFPTEFAQIYKKFLEVHPIVHPSTMIRRSMLPQWDTLYVNKYGVNDDYFTFFKLMNIGKFVNLPDYLLKYRIHLKNSSLINLKDKFYNTVKIRIKAIYELNYKPSLLGIFKLIAQFIVVSLIPETLLLYVYLLVKKVYTPIDIILKLSEKIDFAFIKAKRYSFAFLGLKH